MIELPIAGGFYQSDSLPVSAQQAINWYLNKPQTEGALSKNTLFGSAGLNGLTSTGETPNDINRGGHVKNGAPYFINGETIYRLDRTVDVDENDIFNAVDLGVITGQERALFADNGKQLMIVADHKGWIIDESSGSPFLEITDPDFIANGLPETVSYSDSFFIVTTGSKKFIKSAANDGLNWNALDFGSAEADPDNIVGQIVFKRQVFIGGSLTFEVFENRGIGGFPYQRNGLIINKGLSSKYAIVETTHGIMFLGAGVNETPAIWLIAGNDVQKISTTAIDSIINRYSIDDIQNCFAMSYGQAGAYFVVFTFEKATFEYNTITGVWNERRSRIIEPTGQAANVRWRANSLISAYNRILCGDSIDGTIGEVSRDIYQEYENPIIRTLTTAPFNNQGESFSISKLELTMESGVGGTTEPKVRLSVSKDGKTFNNERSLGFGKVGEYFRRVIWNRLGRFPRWAVIKIEMSEAVKPVIIKMEADISANNGNN